MTHFDQLLDLVTTNFLNASDIQKTNVDTPFGALGDQYISNLTDLEIAIGVDGDLAFFLLNLGAGTFEVKAGPNLLCGLINCIF